MSEQTSSGSESLDALMPAEVAEGGRHGRRRGRRRGEEEQAPAATDPTSPSGLRNPKVMLLALGGVAILAVAGWAFVLPALTGNSQNTATDAPIVHHIAHTPAGLPGTAAKPVAKPLLLAQDFAGVIGRDPFKPLVVNLPPAAATTGTGVPTAGTGTTSTTGGGAGSSSTPAQAPPTKVVLLSVYRTSAGVPHARIQVDGSVDDVLVDGKFGKFFQLNDIINNYVVIQFGDATQVNLYPNEPRYFQN